VGHLSTSGSRHPFQSGAAWPLLLPELQGAHCVLLQCRRGVSKFYGVPEHSES